MNINKNSYKKYLVLLLLMLVLCPVTSFAHVSGVDLSALSRTDISVIYLQLGFTHILPLGLDHILFVLCIFLLNPKLKSVIWQATAFTVAHSITLGLAMYGIITSPSYIIEPIIALSIFFIAVENIITNQLKPSRVAIVFCFGLIHGLGFASVLTDLGLPQTQFVTALITFNIGVELGQITIILSAWLLIGKWFGKKEWYRQRIVIPLSVIIAAIALYWTFERVFFA